MKLNMGEQEEHKKKVEEVVKNFMNGDGLEKNIVRFSQTITGPAKKEEL